MPVRTERRLRTESRTDARKRAQFEAVRRWYQHDWMRIEPKLRTSIVEGVSVFLSLFDDPAMKYTFCPPRQATTRRECRTIATDAAAAPSPS